MGLLRSPRRALAETHAARGRNFAGFNAGPYAARNIDEKFHSTPLRTVLAPGLIVSVANFQLSKLQRPLSIFKHLVGRGGEPCQHRFLTVCEFHSFCRQVSAKACIDLSLLVKAVDAYMHMQTF